MVQEAVRLDPKQEEARRFLGMALDAVGRSPEAITQLQIAVKLKPDDAQARYKLARDLVKSGKIDEALNNFGKVAAADPKNASLRNDFGESSRDRRTPSWLLPSSTVNHGRCHAVKHGPRCEG